MVDTIAIIPARSGSKSVPNKNISFLEGFPLIAYSIAAAKLSKKIERVIVSTNSEKYAEIAHHYGAEVPFIRPENISTDYSIDKDFLLHAMDWLQKKENQKPEFWVHLRPTTPLRSPAKIDRAIEMIRQSSSGTSLRSAHKAPESPLKWFKKNDMGLFESIMKNSDNDEFNLPKENFDDVYIPDGYVDIVKRSFVTSHNTIYGEKILAFESPEETTEVDSHGEFEYIKYQVSKEKSELLEYLNNFSPIND
jgi:N-acylneuraminate cytidylyltransferase